MDSRSVAIESSKTEHKGTPAKKGGSRRRASQDHDANNKGQDRNLETKEKAEAHGGWFLNLIRSEYLREGHRRHSRTSSYQLALGKVVGNKILRNSRHSPNQHPRVHAWSRRLGREREGHARWRVNSGRIGLCSFC
ncbi:hypothetical protein R1flu_016328 [Riccia fluitans]|uniref:Uncharacterized protein n=1 Tax=Riccia fluitans TaxID=41844 RepID=A0ABD1YQE7_9MARC